MQLVFSFESCVTYLWFATVGNDNLVHAVFRRRHFHNYHFCFDEALRVSLFGLRGCKNLP